jgi:hypothetical protein
MASLAALIAAYQEADEPGGGLRATLQLAGRTLLERQARLAAAVGANPIIVLVERLPASLTAAIDRLKGEGFKLVVARSAQEAADAVHPDDRLLLMADGLVAGQSHLERLLGAGPSSLLTVADLKVDDRFERIDAHSRWAGLALLEGDLLQRTALNLRDWDLQSTLLRRAVQGGARQIAVRGDPEDDQLTVAEHSGDLLDMQARIMEGASAARPDWVSRFLLAPLEELVVQILMPGPVTAGWLCFTAVLMTAMAAGAFAMGWLWTGLILLLLATPLEGVGDRLAALRMQLSAGPSWWSYLFPTFAAAALGALAVSLSRDRGWGCIALAAVTITFLIAQRIERGGARVRFQTVTAERKGMAWLLLPFAATGLWVAGLSALALYAAASFFWVQRQFHAPAPLTEQD